MKVLYSPKFPHVLPKPGVNDFMVGVKSCMEVSSETSDNTFIWGRGSEKGLSYENWSGQKLVRADHFSLPKLVRPRTTFGCQKWSGLPKVVRVD